jgi:hypothetical protein
MHGVFNQISDMKLTNGLNRKYNTRYYQSSEAFDELLINKLIQITYENNLHHCIFFLGFFQLAAQKITVRLDGTSNGRVFEGIGAVSAGASTRLLTDYPELAKSQILDLLFTPRLGASFLDIARNKYGMHIEWLAAAQNEKAFNLDWIANILRPTLDRITKTEFWSPFDGIYKSLAWEGEGFQQADQPWSGHYEIWPALWAVAHTTQFTEPGWRYLDSSSGRFSDTTWNGSYVTLRSVSGKDWSMIVTTGSAVEMTVEIVGGLNSGTIHVWKSNAQEQFIEQKNILLKKSMVTIKLEPNSIYTLTTTTGQHKGMYVSAPVKPFPFPYKDDFESYSATSTPKYFSDQKGTFEVADITGHGKCLRQLVTIPGYTWNSGMIKPYSVIGNSEWTDYSISFDVKIEADNVEIGGHFNSMRLLSYRFSLNKAGNWRLFYRDKNLASGSIANFDASFWHRMSLSFQGESISASIDGKQLCMVIDNSAKSGMAYIASTYYPNMFDNFSVDTPERY